jgi:hypothetical protein
MKKKLLAASVAAAFSVMAAPASADWRVNHNGIGHINIIPYYSVQNGNDTHVSITNTDQRNGKVVKVRFRGAEWSDDAFDFTLFLSPGDVWTGVFTQTTDQEGNTVAGLTTYDQSCTLPLTVLGETVPFPTVRLDANKKKGTLEGYVEIITEGEIPPTLYDENGAPSNPKESNPLYDAIVHTQANGYVPLCRSSDDKKNTKKLLADLVSDGPWVWSVPDATNESGGPVGDGIGYANSAQGASNSDRIVSQPVPKTTYLQFGKESDSTADDWIVNPTGSLTSYVTIINVQKSKAVTVPSTAILNVDGNEKGTRTVKRFFRQEGGASYYPFSVVLAGFSAEVGDNYSLGDLTADRIFAPSDGALGTDLFLYEFDLPDLTTPYEVAPKLNEFWTTPTVNQGGARDGYTTYVANNHTIGVYGGISAFLVRDELARKLAVKSVITEYVTDDAINGQTDVVIAQPLRRFFYQYHGVGAQPVSGKPFHRTYAWTNNGDEGAYIFGDAKTPYEALRGADNAVAVGVPNDWGREEERTTVQGGGPVWSPGLQGATKNAGLQGEVSVLAINAHNNVTTQGTDALGALLTVYGVPLNKRDGWVEISTTTTGTVPPIATSSSYKATDGFAPTAASWGLGKALPVLGFTAINLFNGAVGAAGTNYGQFIPLKVVRPAP